MRRISLAAFCGGLLLLPVSAALIIRAIAGPRANSLAEWWGAGRAIGFLAALLLVISVVTAFLTPPDRARCVWWAVPATVLLVVTLLFGWFLFAV